MSKSFLRRHGETILAPVLVAGLYAAMILNSGAGQISQVIAGMFFVALLGLWIAFRRLRVHAAASRLVAIGRPDELEQLVERELPRRLSEGTRAPLRVFAAMGRNLEGRYEDARAELGKAGIRVGSKDAASWQLLWAAADVHARTGLGDVEGAKASFEKGIVRHARGPMTGPVGLLVAECEARIAMAEGDAARVKELVTPMTKDIRLGSAARAQAHALLAEALAREGDGEGAAVHAKKARELAPRCVFPKLPAAAAA